VVNAAQLSDIAERYINGYLSLEVQSADSGPTDPQLASVIFAVMERMSGSNSGVIIDIGCGSGALLTRLLDDDNFRSANGWLYVGVDTEDALDALHSLARKHRMSRRVELIPLDSFYTEWPKLGSPQLVFCRNVFHELNISQSSILLRHIAMNVESVDQLLVQDLMKFPVGEHRNACWVPEFFNSCVSEHGFDTVAVSQKSPNGNAWFNLSARRTDAPAPSEQRSREIVNQTRLEQWKLWNEIENFPDADLSRRGRLVEALDLELQLAALTRQLWNEGRRELVVGSSVEKKVRITEFARRIDDLVKQDDIFGIEINEQVHFRERGEQLTILENFLRGDDRIAVIHGGVGTGKTTIARRVLATRSYNKAVVVVDGRATRSFWAFVEVVFSQVGLRLAPELLSVIGDTRISTIEPALKQFMNAYAHKTIILFDNFSQVHERDGSFTDQALGALLELWASRRGAKILIGSSSQFIPAPLQRAARGAPVTVRVGRYGSDQTVINVLDDRFDRSAAGVEEYPASLLSAIDRHPLIASLAAQNLQKHGADLLLDQKFINELKFRLREHLWNRLVDEATLPVLEIASQLRVPVPRQMLRHFASDDSIYAGMQSELLRTFMDARWGDLLSILGIFRIRDIGVSESETGNRTGVEIIEGVYSAPNHAKISDVYRSIYREDDDPKWIRESYFHAMLAGGGDAVTLSRGLGRYYYDELVASADYSYKRRRDYELSLELYETARKISPLNEQSEMRRASCLIRRKRREVGEEAYAKLIERFPDSRGNKTSHVDALLYIHDYAAAASALEKHNLKPTDDVWVAYEWGRTYLGNDQYKEAMEIFRGLAAREDADIHYHVFYTRCLQYTGAFSESERAARFAVANYPDAHAAQTALGTTLEQNGKLDEATGWLEPLFAERDDNIQAAASLIRIYRLSGRRAEAASALRRAERNCPAQFEEYLVAAKIEMMLMDGGLEAALEEARSNLSESAYSKFILYRAFLDAATMADTYLRSRILREAERTVLTPRYRLNVLAQIQRLEIARMAGNAQLEAEVSSALREAGVKGG
jgi:tetratricopeptide (TPR) repeat protein